MHDQRRHADSTHNDDRGDGQQGTGGLENGQASGTPDRRGKQPHLGSRPDAASGAGGTGLSETGNDSAAGIPAVDRIDQVGVSGHQGTTADATGGNPAAGATGDTSNRLDTIERADERTGHTPREDNRDVGAQTPGDPGDLLNQPLGDGNYQKDGDEQIPLTGNPDAVTGS